MQPHEVPAQEIDAAGFVTATELGQRWQEAAGGSQSSSPVCWSRLQEESRGHLPFATAGPTQPCCFPALRHVCGAPLELGRAAFAFMAMSHQPGAPHCSWDTTLELHSLALRFRVAAVTAQGHCLLAGLLQGSYGVGVGMQPLGFALWAI